MPYVYLVRHAQPDFQGNYDSVTELGVQQAIWLGEHFASRGLRFARAVSGDLVRQVQTLEAINRGLASPVSGSVDSRFNEYDARSLLAHYEGESGDALRARGDRRAYFSAVRDALHAWSSHRGPPRAGESWEEFGARARAGLDTACAGLRGEERLLIVSSGGVIGRLVAELLGAGAAAAIQLNLQTRNTGITELAVGRSATRLVSFNAVPHLEQPGRSSAITHS